MLFISGFFYLLNSFNNYNNSSSFETIPNRLKLTSSPVNGRPLLVNQHANISNSYSNVKSGDNVSFTLVQGWTAKNTTIIYEGVSIKKDWIYNGDFLTDGNGWIYEEVDSYLFMSDGGWKNLYGNPVGSREITIASASTFAQDDFAFISQNVSIPEDLSSKTATLSFDYNYDGDVNYPTNGSLYMAIIMNGVEKNKTLSFKDITPGVWNNLKLQYNPVTYGQVLPGNVTIRVGMYINADCSKIGGLSRLRLDSIKFDLWTKPSEIGLIRAYDVEFSQNYNYFNTTYGEGYSFIDIERSYSSTSPVIFTIYNNVSDIDDFIIDIVTTKSRAIKIFNSTVSNKDGSFYIYGDTISWSIDFSIFIPYEYYCWVTVEKPSDWLFTSLIDGFNVQQIGSCSGIGLGSQILLIPNSIISSGIWKGEATSINYISDSDIIVWKENQFLESSLLTHGDIFQINITLNDTIPISNTILNCTIISPNETVLLHESQQVSSYYTIFGNYSVEHNMTIGEYIVIVEWANNNSSTDRDKVGCKELTFSVWHPTNLTAVDSYFEINAGDPLLLKVKFVDFELNASIHFATITYSSTFGELGTMIYLGSGIYFIDIDTSSLSLGDYYFSFNASKSFYENQTLVNLIHLKIVAEPLDLEVPHYALEGNANSIISCNINATGAKTGSLIYPANISTNWFNPYNITDHNNGTYSLDLSTSNIPTSGYLESYEIEIFANKTYYGNTNEFITLLVHPISTEANVNKSLVSINSNEIVNLKVNYTIKGSNELILGSNCTVTWQGSALISPVSDGFNIKLFTNGLSVDYYQALIKLEKVGFEDAFGGVTIIINEQDVNLTVSINSEGITENSLIDSYFQQTINISVRAYAVIDEEFLSGGTITLISNNFQKNFTEIPSTYFSTSLILDGVNFISGINNIFLRFVQANYTSKIFAFQLFISTQDVNLITHINYQEIHGGYLLEQSFNHEFHISCRVFADIEGVFLSDGTLTFINGEYEVELFENADYWFNRTILISLSSFSIGPNYVYLRFQQENYTTTTFAFQLFVNQLEINVDTLDFEGLIDGAPGETVLIKLNLTETGTSTFIENATVFYSWNFGVGYFNYIDNGIYELELSLPSGFEGNYIFRLVISKEGINYKSREFTFIIDINPVEGPNLLITIIIISLIAVIGILGALSLRSYVILPRRRHREAELTSKIQVFKDVQNIRAVILIHRESGLPIHSQEISILDHENDSLLISGFIQAITSFSEQFVQQEITDHKKLAVDYEYLKTIIDLDFKFFQLLVCDVETIRVLLVLKGEASDQLKGQLYLLALAINSRFQEELRNFTGGVAYLKSELQELLNEYLFLHYNREFEITPNNNYLSLKVESGELTKLEIRLMNVISSMAKINKKFLLQEALDLVDEENKDLVLEALNSLIHRKIIISPYSSKLYQKKEKDLKD